MRNKENEKYVKAGITAGVVILIGLILYFLMENKALINGLFGTIWAILTPFIYGAVIAYLLAPLCNKIEAFLRKRFSRAKKWPATLSIALALLFALIVIIVLLIIVIPKVVQSILQIINALPAQLTAASAAVHNFLESQPEMQASADEFMTNVNATFDAWVETDLVSALQSILSSLSGTIPNLISVFYNLFLGVLISVYMLASRKRIAVQSRRALAAVFPRRWADLIEEEVHYADRMFNGFLVGRIIDSAIVGVICFIFTSLMRFDSAVLVSVIVGVTNVIPVFGPFIGAIPSALFLLLENPLHCLIFVIFIVILQQIDGNIIGPRILGKTTDTSSFKVLFAVLFFGGLWGILGMLIGVPLFAVLYDILQRLIKSGLKKHGRTDLMEEKPPEKIEKAGNGQE